MRSLRLVRISEVDDTTLGVLCIDDRPLFVTLEDAWKNNARRISCIPEGEYVIRRHTSPKFGLCYSVDNVPERSHILIHAGNTAADTNGCILVGLQFGELKGKPAILRSKDAMVLLLARLAEDETAKLTIYNLNGVGRLQ